jgi:WD40 repeat protein
VEQHVTDHVEPPETDGPSKPDVSRPKEIQIFEIKSALGAGPAQPLIIQDARLLPTTRQDVPAERDGKLLCVATPVTPEEEGIILASKIFIQKFGVLAIEVPRNQEHLVPPEDRLEVEGITRGDNTKKMFRPCTERDVLRPGTLQVVYREKKMRKLEVGDFVKAGQLLALVNPALALDEMASKVAKLDAAEADTRAAAKTKAEAQRRVQAMDRQRAGVRGSVSDDEYFGAKLTVARYEEEEIAKAAAVRQTQRELSLALTTLKMHEIRASIDGVVKFIYKHKGEAVKLQEPNVLQIQNPRLLRVEGLVEVQDAKHLRRRLDRLTDANHELIAAIRERDKSKEKVAREKIKDAKKALQVTVEASRPEPPTAVLRGHLLDVTCVAVSKGPKPWIVSGSEDQTVRLWQQSKESGGWVERYRLAHPSVVRAVACSAQNKLLTATADGRGTLFDLDNIKGEKVSLDGRHSGAVTCAAFSPDGKICATGGEDRSIRLWDAANGKLLHRIAGAHKAAVSSLQFASATQLVSAGRDKRLLVWTMSGEEAPERGYEFERRSGDVAVLGVSPHDKRVMFDEGRELRVLSLDGQKIEGTLQNGPGAVNFSTMALFAPDGSTILTNGAAPGRLQLWRAPSDKARASELRQFVWTNGQVTCGAFCPNGNFAVTGTADHQVLVWEMPKRLEAEQPLTAELNYVEEFLDSSLRKVPVRAQLMKPDWVIPGGTATMVIPALRNGE